MFNMNAFSRLFFVASRKCHIGKRTFLSEPYKCREAWEQRLNSSAIKQVNLDDMYHELDHSFQSKGKASVVDVDLFSNRVVDDNYADELEDLVHKLRLSPNTSKTLPSTPHAVIRAYLSMGKIDTLIRILDDRLNYGIFPDHYCSNLMMDTLIKEKKYRVKAVRMLHRVISFMAADVSGYESAAMKEITRWSTRTAFTISIRRENIRSFLKIFIVARNTSDAARVATFQMIQEDWEHPITSSLGLFACHLYLKNIKSEPWEVNAVKNDEPEEEVKVRVRYIRNEFFDDHFDLREPKHLIGKTLTTLSKALPVNDPLRRTYEVIGWALYGKWDKARSILQKLSSSSNDKEYIFSDGVQLLESVLTDGSEDNSEETKEFLKLVHTLPDSKLQKNIDLFNTMEDKLKQIISEHQEKDIINQTNLYKEWEKVREQELKNQMELLEIELRLKKVEEKKKEISEKEEVLFFFENKEKIDMITEKNEEIKSRQVKTKDKSKDVDKDYIPPDVK